MKTIFTFLITLFILATHYTEDCDAQWVQMSNGMSSNSVINALATNSTNIFAGTSGSGVYTSTNNGENWTAVNNGLTYTNVLSLAVSGTNVYAGCAGGVFFSTNNGGNWSLMEIMGINTIVNTVCIVPPRIYVGTASHGVFRTTNNGINWTPINNGMTVVGTKIIYYPGTDWLYAGNSNGVYYTWNFGENWNVMNNGLTGLGVRTLSGNPSSAYLFAGTPGGVFRYYGSWTPVNEGLTATSVYSLTMSGSNLFAGTDTGVFLSTNYGNNWTNKNQGLGIAPLYIPPGINSLLIANNYIFAGTANQSVWRRNYTEILIGIHQISELVPATYSLSQNYPNPFNPRTVIRFQVANGFPIGTLGNDKVVLKVYDVMGREVQTLVNERLQPGTYEATFDGSQLTSGVYFYKISAGEFTETKRMLLIK